MGFLKKFQIGKVAGATVRGFAQGGFYGAALQGGTAAAVASVKAGTARASNYGGGVSRVTPLGTPQMFNAAATLLPTYSGAPTVSGGGGDVVTVSNTQVSKVTQPIVDSLATILNKVGIRWRSMPSLLSAGKRILGRVISMAKRLPGMSPVAMLVGMGLTEMAANQVLTWYTTSGKRRRRMRVTNVKALNRSARRLEGFLKLSRRVESALAFRHHARHTRVPRKSKKC